MLETTLETQFPPGSTMKGDVPGAAWTHLLPSLELGRVVSIGCPRARTLETLARNAHDVDIICNSRRELEYGRQATQQLSVKNVHLLDATSPAQWSRMPTVADLVVVTGRPALRSFGRDRALQQQVTQMLSDGGSIFAECDGPTARKCRALKRMSFGTPLSPMQQFWETPLFGEMQTAVPADDPTAVDFFMKRSLDALSVDVDILKRLASGLRRRGKGRTHSQTTTDNGSAENRSSKGTLSNEKSTQNNSMSRPVRYIGRQLTTTLNSIERGVQNNAVTGWLARRYSMLFGPAAANLKHRPPQYLCDIAEKVGFKLDGLSWGLSAGGVFRSRKVVFYLIDPQTGELRYVVKLPRDAEFNCRIETERHSLERLQANHVDRFANFPKPVFFGHHHNRAIFGQTAIAGVAFENRTTKTIDCPHAERVIDALTELALATVDHRADSKADVTGSLDSFLNHFNDIYRLPRSEVELLRDQLATLAHGPDECPLVVQHGDPHTTNLLIDSDGRVGFVDWEAAEQTGLPLWDLLYFLRAYCMLMAGARNGPDQLRVFESNFLNDGPYSSLIVSAIERYCHRTEIPMGLVEPLFFTCWMHRALREAVRLHPNELGQGHFLNVLKMCTAGGRSETLRRIFLAGN